MGLPACIFAVSPKAEVGARYDTSMGIRDALKQRALELGFDLVGIAPATPGRDLDLVQEWLGRGFAGEMAYLSNPKRLDPKLVLPSIQSVICVGLIYDTPLPYSTEVGSRQKAVGSMQEAEGRRREPGNGADTDSAFQPSPLGRGCPDEIGTGEGSRAWISRYAWGRDYHEIMRAKLEKLRVAVEELGPGTETRVFVDTGPVSERAFARFSGLGWMGKNTCIINEERGSWFFLGVILTSLAIEPDLPAPDRCGSCTACLDACPTGALVEPYVMDAARCISYLTIELKGSIPLEFRPAMGANVFGCDICQDVCPWNGKGRFQVSGDRRQEETFEPMAVSHQRSAISDRAVEVGGWQSAARSQESVAGLASSIQSPKSNFQNTSDTRHPAPDTFSLFAPPLAALAALSEDQFRQAFRHSPIRRAKYRGWLRNLCVAMGNSGDARFITKLQELAAHADPIVREHAEWALARIQHPTDS
jgi:epoxyqueuosine reductase